jgi:5-methylcytosine-specific restriction endonuclease McrA
MSDGRRNQRSPEAAAYRKLYKTAAWQQARQAQLSKQPLCEMCLRRGKVVPATVVNHGTPHKGDWQLFIDAKNHQSVCKPCHDGPVQSAERRGYSVEVGVDGWPIDSRQPTEERH